MAIQMRGGLKVDFDPWKMKPREWAVTTDPETENQIVWMCFRPGVVKRMGTYEDFREQIMEITDEIAEEFAQTLNEIKVYMEGLRDTTEGYKDTTKTYMDTTEGYKDISVQKAEQASLSATNAANSADLSEDYSKQAKSYAKGTDGEVRPNDNSDCAEFYYEQSKRIAQGIQGVIPMGTITFAELSEEYNQVKGYMFDISDDFVSDERFKNGSGIYYGAGSNVIYTADGMWDVLTPTSVMGVKGDKETIYRQGFVNLTPENIGAATKEEVEEIAGSIAGVNADFVGTKEELEAKIASGEVTDGMTAFLEGMDDPSGGGGTVGDLTPNKALISDADGNVTSSTVMSMELEYLTGATSNIQQQIDNIDLSGINADFVGTTAEMQEKIEAGEMKEGTTIFLKDGGGDGSGSGSGGVSADLEPNKAVISDSSGNIVSSSVTDAELESLSGVESNVQEQIGGLRNSVQTEISTLVNTLVGEKLARAIVIAETIYRYETIETWGVKNYKSELSDWGFYKLGKNEWNPFLKMGVNSFSDTYPFADTGTQYLIKNVEMAPMDWGGSISEQGLHAEYSNQLIPLDFFMKFMEHCYGYGYKFSWRPDTFSVEFYYDSNTLTTSPWANAFVKMRTCGNYYLPNQSVASAYSRYFFRMTIINLFELFSESFLNDPKNSFIQKTDSGVIKGLYFKGVDTSHVPIDGKVYTGDV